jgi:plastocyanin
MRSFQSLLVSALTIFVIMALTTGTASMVLFDISLIANAQSPPQGITSQPVTQQQQEEETIIRQGTVTSSQDPLLGHEEHQMATILPFRQDGTIYAGVLTYTSTQPLQVVILNMQILNETEQQILNDTEDGEFGTLLTSQLDNQTSIAISYIIPEYGDSPAPSASIPFAGNAVWLHTLSVEPFAATFAASAQVLKSEIRNNISNLADTTVTVTPEVDEIDAEDVGTANTTAAATEGAGIEEEAEDAIATTTSEDNIASTTDANNVDADDDAANNEEEVIIVRIPQDSSSLTDDAYIPNPVEVNVGDTVTWINDDFTTHTATSGGLNSGSTGMFGGTEDSPEIIGPEGDTQSYTFDEAGEFPYYCTLHPSMVGTVVVTEG